MTRLKDVFIHTGYVIRKSVFMAQQNDLSVWTGHAATFYLNSGIRAEIYHTKNKGNITVEDMMTAIPFQNLILQCTLPGSSLKEALEVSANSYDPLTRSFSNFLHFSGLKVAYNLKKTPNNRVQSVKIICTECPVPQYEKLDTNKLYSIILDSYILNGTDQYSVFQANCKNVRELDKVRLTTSDIVTEYIQRHKIVYPKLDGRVHVCN